MVICLSIVMVQDGNSLCPSFWCRQVGVVHTACISWYTLATYIALPTSWPCWRSRYDIPPAYLSQHIRARSGTRSLRSSAVLFLNVPFRRTDIGKWSFSCAAPATWNSLPPAVINCDTLSLFKSRLKTHLFNTAYLFRQHLWSYSTMVLYKCIIIITSHGVFEAEVFMCQMPFLLPNQQHQSTEDNRCQVIIVKCKPFCHRTFHNVGFKQKQFSVLAIVMCSIHVFTSSSLDMKLRSLCISNGCYLCSAVQLIYVRNAAGDFSRLFCRLVHSVLF